MLASAFAVDETYKLEDALSADAGRIYLTGMQALARMAMAQRQFDVARGLDTAGFITGYRGSPVAGLDLVLTRIRDRLEAHRIQFHPGLNEALAASSLLGTQQVEASGNGKVDGVFGLWYGKGPGVDWAGDALKHGNAFGTSPHGGVLAVAGDDHGAISSTMGHQSDQAFKAWSMPVLHPAHISDYLELGLYGWALSRYCGAWVGFKAVSETVEGAASVELAPRMQDFITPTLPQDPPGGLHYRFVDPPSIAIEERLLAKIAAAEAFAGANRPDRLISDPARARLLIVTTGKAHLDGMEALRRLGFADSTALERAGVRVVQIRQSWPIDRKILRHALAGVETVLVIEEKRPLVEEQVIELCYRDPSISPRILGKQDEQGRPLLPGFGELRPHLVAPLIAAELQRAIPGLDLSLRLKSFQPDSAPAPAQSDDAKRTPYFCSGCPHNSSTVLPKGAVAFGGIGCHVMASWMDRGTIGVTQMGGEGSNWIGLEPFVEAGHAFQNLGDGTYMHSGSLAIRAALAAGSNITFKLLFNDAVAMTGGQAHDGALDVPTITRQLRAEGVERIVIVSDEPGKYLGTDNLAPGIELFHRRELDTVQRSLQETRGVSVLIFDQTCAAEKRRRRKRGSFPNPVKRAVINDLVCEACGDCSKASNCLSIQPLETALGTKRQIDHSSCNKDFSCVEGFCPSFVTVEGAELKKPEGVDRTALIQLAATLPHPNLPAVDPVHEVLVTGVGGTGVLTVGAVIGMAAHLESRAVSVLDFTGLAQKGGAVASHIRIANRAHILQQSRIEPGQTHALIACDLVTAAEQPALMTLDRARSRAVANAHAMATADFIANPRYALPMQRLQKRVAARLSDGELPLLDAHRLAEQLLGDAIGTNMVMLGAAWQRGLLPLSLRAIERAIELNKVAVDANKAAFALGRIAVANAQALNQWLEPEPVLPRDLEAIIAHRSAHLTGYQDAAYAGRYKAFVRKVAEAEADAGGTGSQKLATTVAEQLFRLMAYKDEYEVARLHTDGRFRGQLQGMFAKGGRRVYHLAPPLLSWLSRDGQPRKMAFGPWIEPVLHLLARGKVLRGTAFDPFGWTAERRRDRALIEEYVSLIERELALLDANRLDHANKIAALPDLIRGFGHVRERGIREFEKRRDGLLAGAQMPKSTQNTAHAVAAE